MQAIMEFSSYRGGWVVKKTIYIFFIMLVTASVSTMSYATHGESPENIPADQIRSGCSVSFSKELHPNRNDPLSTPLFAIVASWHCIDGEQLPLDRYEINGSSPEVAIVFYWRKRDVVVLVKWPINSRAADYSGNYYDVFIYEYDNKYHTPRFVRNQFAQKYFFAGFDGVAKDGSPVKYPFDNSEAIRKKIQSIDFQ
jgi:hypothetical protein